MQQPSDQTKLIEKMKRYALYLLARRDHTPFELRQKFKRKDYPAADIESVLTRLEETGLINIQRFTESFIRYRRSKGYGPRRIAMDLEAKGVPEAMIAEHLEITDNAWLEEIRSVWKRRFKGKLPEDYLTRAKQMRFLYSRGFTQDQIKHIFNHVTED